MVSQLMMDRIRARAELYMTEVCVIEQEERETDIYGAPSHRWRVVANQVKCRIIREGGSRSGDVGSQEAMIERYRLICPAGTALGVDQRVTVGGVVYQVAGVVSRLTDAVDAQAIIVRVRND